MSLGVPDDTKFDVICSHGGCTLVRVPRLNAYFLNHWEVLWYVPVFFVSVIISAYFLKLRAYEYVYGVVPQWIVVWQGVCMVMYVVLYVMVIWTGPGYMPWYHRDEPQRVMKNGALDYWSGMALDEEQMSYGCQDLPRRVKHFKRAHRFVITADHFCFFTGSFIGRRNYKLFFYFNFWAVQYLLSAYVLVLQYYWKWHTDTGLWFTTHWSLMGILVVAFACIGVYFVYGQTGLLVQGVHILLTGVTSFEVQYNMLRNPYFDRGILWERVRNYEKNLEYFCGPNKWTWLLPVSAFWGVDDYTLAHVGHEEEEPFL